MFLQATDRFKSEKNTTYTENQKQKNDERTGKKKTRYYRRFKN